MADLPSSVGFLTVTGRLVLGMGDSVDPGNEPDMLPAAGTVTFTPNLPGTFPLVSLADSLMIAPATVKAALDEAGNIVPPSDGGDADPATGGTAGVFLVAPQQPTVLSNIDWTWTVSFAPATGQRWKPFSRSFTGKPGDVLDIATLIPVPASPGAELTAWQSAVAAALAARDQTLAARDETLAAGGASAYDLWKAAGNSGSQADFLASLQGQKGDPGDPGTPGAPGAPGAAATITAVTVSGLAAGATPTVTLGGTSSARTIALGIPAGAAGAPGAPGAPGAAAVVDYTAIYNAIGFVRIHNTGLVFPDRTATLAAKGITAANYTGDLEWYSVGTPGVAAPGTAVIDDDWWEEAPSS